MCDLHTSRYTKVIILNQLDTAMGVFLKTKLYYLYFGTIVSNSQNGSLQAVQDYQGTPSQTHPHIQHLEQRNRFMAAASAE